MQKSHLQLEATSAVFFIDHMDKSKAVIFSIFKRLTNKIYLYTKHPIQSKI